MNPNKLDELLTIAKNENINTFSIDCKVKCLKKNSHRHYISPKASFATVLGLFAIVSILSSYNAHNQKQQQIALQQIQEQRSTTMHTEYIYDTVLASYQGNFGE